MADYAGQRVMEGCMISEEIPERDQTIIGIKY